MMSGNGLSRPKNSGDGVDWIGNVRTIIEFCFAMEIRESVKHLSGNKD